MGVLRVMCAGGDMVVKWDYRRVETGNPEATAVKEAERIFDEARNRGSTAFRAAPGKPAERLDRFDPKAEQIIVIPQLIGG